MAINVEDRRLSVNLRRSRVRPAGPRGGALRTDSPRMLAPKLEEIAPDTLETFTRATGIHVNYETYELNQVLEARLLVGNTGLDLVVPSNNFVERQIEAGVYRSLDRSLLPNLEHLDPALLEQVARNDPGNAHTVAYLWGTHGVGYDVARVEASLGGPAPDSWALLFDPRYASKLAGCGIILLDAPRVLRRARAGCAASAAAARPRPTAAGLLR